MTTLLASSSGTGWMTLLFLVGLYFLPWLIAAMRGVKNQGSVAVVNVFFGWTVIGWVVALAMAARSVEPTGGGKDEPRSFRLQ